VAVQVRVDEPAELGDPSAAQGEDVDRAQGEAAAAVGVLVAGEGQLPVGPGRDQPPGGGEHPLGQEPADVAAAREPGRQRRHDEAGILGQQLQQGRHVGPLPGGHEGVDQLPAAVRAQGGHEGQLDVLALLVAVLGVG
jgi:hypothetical protein